MCKMNRLSIIKGLWICAFCTFYTIGGIACTGYKGTISFNITILKLQIEFFIHVCMRFSVKLITKVIC